MSSELVVRKTKILLTNKNYALWLLPIEAKLHKLKYLNVVNNTVAIPDPEKDKDNFKLYVKYNKDAYAEIIQLLSQEVLAYFNGQKLWSLLKSKYAGDDLTAKTTALKQFLAVDYNNFLLFMPSIRSANQKINLSQLVLDDQVRTILMLDKLPQEFHSFKTNISMNFETIPFNQVLKKLEDFGAQNQLNTKTSPGLIAQTALHTNSTEAEPKGNFTWFRTPDGGRYNINDVKFENVSYF
ncbi:hypothetical protein PTTG_06132 [Puccinia triticina 1-1 BBBD Race 1]|uniref:Uncharacterized protein n=1 Tax=Puccinia triticina (isolate 1-1 / race 1 (BBBD)) TaxID=630390 RepID=A0A0C4EZ75_PUCT1|nr:hypothetical protein PTTG_06132 [Puccinia triticina 1-1 BBBD Race 1]